MSRSIFRLSSRTALAIAVVLIAGCVAQPVTVTEIVAPRRPPPAVVEVVPAPPRPIDVVVWEPGHWHWNGRDFVWESGRYVERPHRAAIWENGHWVQRGAAWTWIPGHWR